MSSPPVDMAPAELAEAIRSSGGNMAAVARLLGVTYRQARYAIQRSGISWRAAREQAPDLFVVAPLERTRAGGPRIPRRVLGLERCDAPRRRAATAADNGSGCHGPAIFGEPEVTEILVRFVGVDLRVESNNAWKEAWWARKRRVDRVHGAVREALGKTKDGERWTPPPLPDGWGWRVTFTRVAFGRLDSDNLTACFKAHRDAVADLLGLNDRDPRIEWRAEQARTDERATVRRRDYKAKQWVMRPGYRCFFRVKIEQVKGETP